MELRQAEGKAENGVSVILEELSKVLLIMLLAIYLVGLSQRHHPVTLQCPTNSPEFYEIPILVERFLTDPTLTSLC